MHYFERALENIGQLQARLRSSNSLLLFLVATLLGIVISGCVWLFEEAVVLAHAVFVTTLANGILAPGIGSLGIVIVLAGAGALVGLIMDRFVGIERHHGVAGIVEAVAIGGGHLRYRQMPFKALASALSLGAGASVGPEDPSVQIGANLGSYFGETLHLSEEHMRILVAAGAAAAIAAAFNAPIAGVFFALEVILNGTFESRSFGIIVLTAAVSSGFTGAISAGHEMGPFTYALGSPLEIPLFLPLGVLLGGVSVLFMRAVDWQHDIWHRQTRWSRPAKTALAGALIGLIGVFLPEILGPGRETMNAILSGETTFTLVYLLALGAFKLLMTSVSLASGFVGGIFAPSLFVGTALGSGYGAVIVRLFPDGALGDSQAYAIAGMAAVMAGVVRSPITAIMLVFELTNDYRLILPIMLAAILSVSVAGRFEPLGIYSKSLLRKGIRLPEGRETDLMQGITVAEAMLKPAPTIRSDASLVQLRDALREYHSHSLCVVDQQDLLCGVVTLADLRRGFEALGADSRTVADVMTSDPITVTPEDTLWNVISIMNLRDIGRLPVVEPGTRRVVGLIGRHGVVRAYALASARKLEDQHLADQVRLMHLTGANVVQMRVEPNAVVVGKCIADVPWPRKMTIAAVRRSAQLLIPRGETCLMAEDGLIVVSEDRQFDWVALRALLNATASPPNPGMSSPRSDDDAQPPALN